MGNEPTTNESGVKKINLLDMVPDCCRENRDDCIHKLKPEPKREYNPI